MKKLIPQLKKPNKGSHRFIYRFGYEIVMPYEEDKLQGLEEEEDPKKKKEKK